MSKKKKSKKKDPLKRVVDQINEQFAAIGDKFDEHADRLKQQADQLDKMERKLSREEEFQTWKDRSAAGGGQFGFAWQPTADNYPQIQ